MKIHPTSIIHDNSKIDDSVEQNNYILIIKKDFANEIIDKLSFDIRTNGNK